MIATRACHHCGREQPASAAFCAACGQEFRAPRFGDEVPPPVPSWDRRAGLQGKPAMRVMVALLAALAAAAPFALGGFAPSTSLLVFYAVVGAVVLFCAAQERDAIAPLLLRSGGVWLLLAAPAAYATQGFGWLWVQLLQRADALEELEGIGAVMPSWALLLGVVLAPAVFEELAFRGIFLRNAQNFLRPWPAHLATAFAFAAIHLQPLMLPFHFGMGLALGGLRVASGSLWPSMILHAVNNALAAGLLPGSPFAP